MQAPEVHEFVYEGGGSGDVIGAFPHARGVLIGGSKELKEAIADGSLKERLAKSKS